jgi:hypothetical protein
MARAGISAKENTRMHIIGTSFTTRAPGTRIAWSVYCRCRLLIFYYYYYYYYLLLLIVVLCLFDSVVSRPVDSYPPVYFSFSPNDVCALIFSFVFSFVFISFFYLFSIFFSQFSQAGDVFRLGGWPGPYIWRPAGRNEKLLRVRSVVILICLL